MLHKFIPQFRFTLETEASKQGLPVRIGEETAEIPTIWLDVNKESTICIVCYDNSFWIEVYLHPTKLSPINYKLNWRVPTKNEDVDILVSKILELFIEIRMLDLN